MKLRTLPLVAAGAIAALAALNTSPAAGGVKEGIAAHRAGDFETAFREFLPVARAGDPRAQNIIGSMYYGGQGIDHDPAEAAKWFQKAADQGHAEAQYKLGLLYRLGRGVPQDEQKAREWLQAAAKQGHEGARTALSASAGQDGKSAERARLQRLYNEGISALKAKNYELGFSRMQEVAEHGVAQAQFIVGVMLCKGEGVPTKDVEACVVWLRRAADQGHNEAQEWLASVEDPAKDIQDDKRDLSHLQSKLCKSNTNLIGLWSLKYQEIRPRSILDSQDFDRAQFDNMIEELRTKCGASSVLAEAISTYLFKGEFARARDLSATSCAQDEHLGCHFHGLVLLTGDGGPKNPAAGRALLQRACDSGLNASCVAVDRLAAR